jgi:hypothetical protein
MKKIVVEFVLELKQKALQERMVHLIYSYVHVNVQDLWV